MDMLKGIKIPRGWSEGPEYLPDELVPAYDSLLFDNNYSTIEKQIGNVTYYILIADNANYFTTSGNKYCVHLFKVGEGVKSKQGPELAYRKYIVDGMDFISCFTCYYKKDINTRIEWLLECIERDLNEDRAM